MSFSSLLWLQVWYFSREAWKAKVEEYIQRQIRGKPYANTLIVDVLFIDNTRSGSFFWSPDETTLKLRQLVLTDAQEDPSSSDPIPLRWLPFTQGLEDEAAGKDLKPVLTMDEIAHKAYQLCGIPPEEVPDMVHFHHQLGLLLHFESIPSLRQNVITNVPWVIKVTSALLHPLSTGHRDYETQFRLLHDHGILLESLAMHVWSVRCPDEAVHLSSSEQRAFIFRLYENFDLLYDTGKTMVPPGGSSPSHAWLCPPLVRKLGEAVGSLSESQKQGVAGQSTRANIDKSPHMYLVCKEGLNLLHTQYWRLIVECLCIFHTQDASPSELRVEGTRMPSLFHRSARLPCDAVFPGHHLCITYFNEGVELVVLCEAAAVKARKATGGEVKSLDKVCSRLLRLVEGKLEELKGGGIAQPVLRRMGGCRCPLSSSPCTEHRRRGCHSPGCLHFVNLEDEIPSCPLGEHPAQNEVVEEVYPVWLKVRLVTSTFLPQSFPKEYQTSYSRHSPSRLFLPPIGSAVT